MRSRGFGRPWGQYLGLLVLALGTVALIYLALARDSDSGEDLATDPTSTPSASDSGSASLSGDASPSSDPTSSETATEGVSTTPPTVRDQRRRDFTAGEGLPDGSLIVDGGGNESGLALTKKGLTHGNPTSGALAAGVIETKFNGDVRALGFRVRFAEQNPGQVNLVAWQTSIAKVIEEGGDTAPSSGFRLVATPGEWTLSVIEQGVESTLAEGTYTDAGGSRVFQIVRDGAQAWVVDPTGAVTTATDPRVASLAGPWASWGLTETAVDQKPALIEAVWGG